MSDWQKLVLVVLAIVVVAFIALILAGLERYLVLIYVVGVTVVPYAIVMWWRENR